MIQSAGLFSPVQTVFYTNYTSQTDYINKVTYFDFAAQNMLPA